MPIYSLTYFTNVLGFFKNEKFKVFIIAQINMKPCS